MMVTTLPHGGTAPPIDEHPDLVALSSGVAEEPAEAHEPAREVPRPPRVRTWLAVAAVGIATGLLGFIAGMVYAPAPTLPVEVGWASSAYGLAHEHLAQAPLSAAAAVSLAQEHLAQLPASAAAVSLAHEHLAQLPASAAAVSLAHEHLAQAPS